MNDEPSLEPEQLFEDASLALEDGDIDTAYELARQAIRLAPEDTKIIFLMARILGQRQRFPEAIQMLDELAETEPAAELPVLGQTADWMVRFGQWREAETRYRALLKVVPDAVLVHRNLARLLVRQGRRFEAAKHLRLLCRLGDVEESELRQLLMIVHPFAGDATNEDFDPVGARGIGSKEISQGDWESARARLEALGSIEPESIEPEASALLARIYVNLNDMEALRNWSAAAPESSEQCADAWFAKGALAASKGDHAGAIRCFAETVLRDQTDRHAYSLMSQSLAALDAPKESAEAANRAQLIEQTQTLGAEMAETPERDDAKLLTLIELLEELHRPMEALGWRGMRLAYARSTSSLSDAEEKKALADISRDRLERLSGNDAPATRQFLLCGVDLNALAEKDRDQVVSESEP